MPNKILRKVQLSDTVFEMDIEAALLAQKAQPGHFLILRIHERGERIPLTVADYDRKRGTITIVFMVVGATTKELSMMNEGDYILDFVGPLGNPADIEKFGTVILIGGGVGIAPIYPQAKALKAAGNHIISIIGARTKSLLFWEDKMRSVSDELIVCTDDGSYGRKALVTQALEEIREKANRVIAIGPLIMMKFVTKVTEADPTKNRKQIPTWVSLNPIMVDGTGMCGGCRCEMKNGTIFVCADGPDVDGHLVMWDSLMARNKRYMADEKKSMDELHSCKLDEKCEEIREHNRRVAEEEN
jgi:ferredoxin--NADP+ reductase